MTSCRPTPEPIVEPVVTAPVESEIQAVSDEHIAKADELDGAKAEPGKIFKHVKYLMWLLVLHWDLRKKMLIRKKEKHLVKYYRWHYDRKSAINRKSFTKRTGIYIKEAWSVNRRPVRLSLFCPSNLVIAGKWLEFRYSRWIAKKTKIPEISVTD